MIYFSAIFVGIFLLFPNIIIFSSVIEDISRKRKWKDGSGVIKEIFDVSLGDSSGIGIRVLYHYEGKSFLQSPVGATSGGGYSLGSTIEIKINPELPEQFILARVDGAVLPITFIVLFDLVFISHFVRQILRIGI